MAEAAAAAGPAPAPAPAEDPAKQDAEAKPEGAEGAEGEEAAEEAATAPIIVKKIVGGHGGAHGGAWKIALADMMTAMMAFFLLMWILGASTEDQRKSIADYFKPSLSHSLVDMGKAAGSNGIMGGQSIIDPEAFPNQAKQTALMERVTPRSEGGPTENDPKPNPEKLSEEQKQKIAEAADQAAFDKLENEIKDKLAQNKRLENIKEQVQFIREKEGLRIEIIDKADFSMFGLGTSKLSPRAQALIEEVASSVAKMPNKMAIRGHTDSVAFDAGDRNNWTLSAERSDATRQMLEKRGIAPSRFARIEGVADTAPFNPKDPLDPRNRRISITVLHQSGT